MNDQPASNSARPSASGAQLEEAIASGDYVGFCLACGEEQDGCEPDARQYECETCGEHQVHGAEEILIMGHYTE